MKNSLLTLLLVFNLLATSSCDKKNITDLQTENLKGNIVALTKSNFKVTEKFGEPIKGARSCNDLEICKTSIKYNEMGNMIEFSEFDTYGITSVNKIKYNEADQKIELNRYTPVEGKLLMKFIYKYDESGNCINVSSEPNYHEENKYDGKNRLIKKTIVYGESDLRETTYLFNDKDQIITESNSYGKVEYTYFDDGNKKNEIHYDSTGKVEIEGIYKYIYDENKNWVGQIAYQNDAPVFYLEREIEYKK